MTARLSNEFRLAAACCRWPSTASRERAIAEAAVEGLDWPKFLRIVRRQRVEGLVDAALRQSGIDVPGGIASELAASSAAIARENLLHAAASLRLQRSFGEAGIPILFVKGVTLSMLAYGTLALKKARDIDIVVPPEALGRAFELLEREGYRCLTAPPVSGGTEARKDTEWADRSGILLELHGGLVDNPLLLPGLGASSPSQLVSIGSGKSLPTLRKDELFSYLCVHGATHAWSRLKWLADVAALLEKEDEAEIERLYRRSIELGAGRSSAQALLLCSDLLGVHVPANLLRELRSDRATRWLVSVALISMAGSPAERELDETVLGTVPIHLSHFLLERGRKYKFAELRRKSAGRPTATRPKLPGYLKFLDPVIAVPLWLRSRVRERLRR